MCELSGPGLQSATANHPTHVLVELRDSVGSLHLLQKNITAELEIISEASNAAASPETSRKISLVVDATSHDLAQYKVLFTPDTRGLHKLHVRVNYRETNGSPFTITVYPDPVNVKCPVRVVKDIQTPYGIAVNSRGEMIVSECKAHQISIIDNSGKTIRKFGSIGRSPEQMVEPTGVGIDKKDNIYVSSSHKLQKFTSRGELIKCVGYTQKKSGEAEFDDPRGVTLHIYNNQMYVCDRGNDRIQVFDLQLNWVKSISSHDKGVCEFYSPLDVKFDTAGNLYIAEYSKERVQVIDTTDHFVRMIGKEKLNMPTALHIIGKYVYVSDFNNHCIAVYETSGQFVTSFGSRGDREGEFDDPYCITSCANGFVYVCDFKNNRVQIF